MKPSREAHTFVKFVSTHFVLEIEFNKQVHGSAPIILLMLYFKRYRADRVQALA